MKNQDAKQYRHGDVQIIRFKALPKDEMKLLDGRKELAFGEVTGHAHRVELGDLFETKGGELYFKAPKATTVDHEEHKKHALPKGVYRIVIKRQYTPGSWLNVRD